MYTTVGKPSSDTVDSSLYSLNTCRILGIMMACGQMDQKTTSVYVTSDLIECVTSCLPTEHYVHEQEWQNVPKVITRVFWKNTSEFPIDARMLYSSSDMVEKGVPREVIRLPEYKLFAFLKGFIDGNSIVIGKEYILRLTTPGLWQNIETIFQKLKIKHRTEEIHNTHLLTFSADATPIEKKGTLKIFKVSIDVIDQCAKSVDLK